MDTHPNDDTRAYSHKDANAPEAGSPPDEATNAPEPQDIANDTDAAQSNTALLPVPPPYAATFYSNGFASTDGRNFVSYTYRYDGSRSPTALTHHTYARDTAGSKGATAVEAMPAADTNAVEPDIETWLREWDRIQNEAAANLRARQQDPPMQ